MIDMNFEEMPTDKKISIERNFLVKTRGVLKEQLKNRETLKEKHLDPFILYKMLKLIDRVIDNELDYLHDDPQEYFELYCKDHLDN